MAVGHSPHVMQAQVTLDLNHELAGKALTFDVELVGLCPAERMQKATFGAGGWAQAAPVRPPWGSHSSLTWDGKELVGWP